MHVLRTPDERFADLPDYPFEPRYLTVHGNLRMHYVDEGPGDAAPVLLLHGEPTWSFLYRHMIVGLVERGHRVVAPDLIGFGRSDKPAAREDYTYRRHLRWATDLFLGLELSRVTLFCQDWGGLIGLRLVAAHADRFDRVVASNTWLPVGTEPVSDAFVAWRTFSQETPSFPIAQIVQMGCTRELVPEVLAAYEAPFPDESYKAGARQFPVLVPTAPGDAEAEENREAWTSLARFDKPFVTAFGDSDPITRGADRFLQARIHGAAGQPHRTIAGGGHFVQEDRGDELTILIDELIRSDR